MQSDAIIEIRFKTPGEQGRLSSVSGNVYGCPLIVDGETFDCRIYLGGQTLVLGEIYEVPVKFLNPQLALTYLFIGKPISLWEGKVVATGKVIRFGN